MRCSDECSFPRKARKMRPFAHDWASWCFPSTPPHHLSLLPSPGKDSRPTPKFKKKSFSKIRFLLVFNFFLLGHFFSILYLDLDSTFLQHKMPHTVSNLPHFVVHFLTQKYSKILGPFLTFVYRNLFKYTFSDTFTYCPHVFAIFATFN